MHKTKLEIFTTTECKYCPILKKFLNERSIPFIERIVDMDIEAETDAIMLNIFSAPALRVGNSILRAMHIFKDDELDGDAVLKFVNNENNQ